MSDTQTFERHFLLCPGCGQHWSTSTAVGEQPETDFCWKCAEEQEGGE